VFTRPTGIAEEQIRAELAASWNFGTETLSYLPVGFGSYHWRATDAAGRQLFLVAHDLLDMLKSRLDTAEAAFGRMATAFGCALSLRRNENLEFVIAPVPTVSGEIVRRLSGRYSLAVCPYLTDCEPWRWDLAETDRSVLAAYTEATGTVVDSAALALFRMWYDLAEIAGYIELFRGAHDDTEDTAESWKNLEYFLRPAERWPQLRLPAP
jgi:hypothetical protein